MLHLRCIIFAAVLVLTACEMAASQKISWKQSKGQVNCATDHKYLCGRVHSVHDGDSIRVRPDAAAAGSATSVRVRLLQLDAPELRQPHGPQSRDALARRLPPGSRVCVVSPGRDNYHRVLGFVCLLGGGGGGLDVNALMLSDGQAWCYRRRCCPPYSAAEEAAKATGRGLWASAGAGGPQPQPPWLYRRRQRRQRQRKRLQPLRYAVGASSGDSTGSSSSSMVRK